MGGHLVMIWSTIILHGLYLIYGRINSIYNVITALEILQLAEILLLGQSSRHCMGFLPLLLVSTEAGPEDRRGWRVLVEAEAAEVEDGEAVGGGLRPLETDGAEGEVGGEGLREGSGAQLANFTSSSHSPAQT